MIEENQQHKNKDFIQRVDNKEDPRKEDQWGTINTSAMVHNKNSRCWSQEFPPRR